MTPAEKTIVRLLDDGEAIVRSTVITENGIRYYAIDDLIKQKTIHVPVSEIKLWFLTADTTNGVQSENREDGVCIPDLVSQDIFFASLKGLEDDDYICSYVTHQMYGKITVVYGISK